MYGDRRDLGVVCEGISRVNSVFWNGIRLVPSSTGKVSRLEHVDILHAGQDDGAGTTVAISIKTYSPVLRDVNVKYSAGAGVKVQGATTEVNMADCGIEENQGPGIIIEDQAADVNIRNTRFSKNFPYGAQVIRGSHGHKIALTDSAFTENFGTGLLLDSVRSEVVISSSNFSSNTHFGLDSINSQMSTLLIQSCTLNSNGLDGVLIKDPSRSSTIPIAEESFSIIQSSLSENLRRGVTVSIMYPSYNSRDHRTLLNVTASEISANLDGAIDFSVVGSTSTCYPTVLLDNTDFKSNGGDVVTISGSWSDVEVRNNVFQENTCGPNNVLFFTGQGKNVSCSFNTFQQNLCKRLGLFNVTELADVKYMQQTFTENDFTDNDYDPPFLYKSDPLRDYCTLEFSGEWRPISITHNSFQQDVSRFDLCSTVWTNSWDGPTIDATHNWWGTDDEEVIREKIFDYNDWNSGAQVTYSPFLDSAGGNLVDAIVNLNPTAQAFGGLLVNDLHITKGDSPVLMKSDLTILPGATLTLDPGVEVRAAPGAGILNYGHINMVGSDVDPVILGAQSNDNIASKENHLRLSSPGSLEVFHAGTWKSVCYDYRGRYNHEDQVLACRQLGLGPPRSFGGTSFGVPHAQKVVVRCDGGEESFQQCSFYDVAPDDHRCGSQSRITCEPTPGWGGIRSHGQDKTKVDHVLFKDIGQLHKRRSSALSIENIDGAMTLQNIEIDRCLQSRAGVEIFSPPSQTTVQHLTVSACEAESVLSVTNSTGSVTLNSVSITGTSSRVLSNTVGIRMESPGMTNSGPTVTISNTLTTDNDYGMKLTGGQGGITVENSEARSNDHGVRIERWTGDVEITRVNAGQNSNGVYVYHSTGNVVIDQVNVGQNFYECLIDDNVFIDNFYSHENTDGNFRYDDNIRNTSCTLQFDGYRRAVRFHRNVFENPRVDHQVCSNIPSRSAEDFVDGRFNWWGTTIENEVRDAIFDFDDHNDHAAMAYLPYLTSSDVTIVPWTSPASNTDMPLPLLGGRLYSDLHLTLNNSPYTLTSDLTILPNVTLTIDPGVEIHAYPCVGLLNLGTLVANGTKQQPITFGQTSGATDEPSLFRLTDGKYPWEGKVEVFFEGQ
ncbi:Hypp7647 [Branchiostoma lanceolatum]|uniref:Hypp7647 protein n=1 Tax=Branchiostoma lanceolatum TaxID=7740 RepID=A0A8J9Z1U1_BRALA|nr:Hypp7647 [Branchiostoma lanceolatum]